MPAEVGDVHLTALQERHLGDTANWYRSPVPRALLDGGPSVLCSRRRTLCADAHGRFAAGCEDVGVSESAVICAVCHRSNLPGNHSDAGDLFICARCQADAAQFIAVQDPIVDADQALETAKTATPSSIKQ